MSKGWAWTSCSVSGTGGAIVGPRCQARPRAYRHQRHHFFKGLGTRDSYFIPKRNMLGHAVVLLIMMLALEDFLWHASLCYVDAFNFHSDHWIFFFLVPSCVIPPYKENIER